MSNKPELEKNNKVSAGQDANAVFLGLVNELLSSISVRSREIIFKRFGLSQEKPKTLEKIGQEYKITRERVRQIIIDAIRTVSTRLGSASFVEVENKLILAIEKNYGIIKESSIVEKFNSNGSREANAIRFIAQCSKKIRVTGEKGVIERSWVLSESSLERAIKVCAVAKKILEAEKRLFTASELSEAICKSLSNFSRNEIESLLEVLVPISKNTFGKWGMSSWNLVNPKGAREKIYLVLRESKKPLHFVEIAKLIDKYKLGKRKAHPQTIHNELIKDDRFVLIGRGTYALSEWGYREGTIKDVLKEIMTRSAKPLAKEDILREVLKIRQVKKTTIMINLNNNNIFAKVNNLYSLKQK